MSTNFTTTILETQCIGDSLDIINNNFDGLDTAVTSVSASLNSTIVNILTATDSAVIDLTYNSVTRSLSADIINNSITTNKLANNTVTLAKLDNTVTTFLSSIQTTTLNSAINTTGKVYSVVVTSGGSNYSSNPTVTIEASPTGDTARATAVVSGGSITSIVVTYQGSGYRKTVPTVTITDTTGTNATAICYALVQSFVDSKFGGGCHLASHIFTANGTLESVGRNNGYQLGRGANTGSPAYRYSPVLFWLNDLGSTYTTPPQPIKAWTTYYGIYVLCGDGTLWSCGFNSNGQLGLGDNNPRGFLTRIPPSSFGNKPIVDFAVTAGNDNNSCIALNSDNQVYTWGFNSGNYILGNSTTTSRNTPGLISSVQQAGLTIRSVFATGRNGACNLGVVYNDGSVRIAGYNGQGQCSNGSTNANQTFQDLLVSAGTKLTGVIDVKTSGGEYHAHTNYFLTSSGNLYSSGANAHGGLGNGTTTSTNAGYVNIPTGITNCTAIYCNTCYSVCFIFAVLSTGVVRGWGWNGNGNLGIGNTATQLSPVTVWTPSSSEQNVVEISTGIYSDYTSSALLLANGQVRVTGYNGSGRLGNGINNDISSWQLIPAPTNYKAIKVGWAGTDDGGAAILGVVFENGEFYATGYNGYGTIGDNSTNERWGLAKVDV